MAALTQPDVDLILGFGSLAVGYLGTHQYRAKRAAKKKLAEEVRELIDSYKEQVDYLRTELDKERRRRRGRPDDQS